MPFYMKLQQPVEGNWGNWGEQEAGKNWDQSKIILMRINPKFRENSPEENLGEFLKRLSVQNQRTTIHWHGLGLFDNANTSTSDA